MSTSTSHQDATHDVIEEGDKIDGQSLEETDSESEAYATGSDYSSDASSDYDIENEVADVIPDAEIPTPESPSNARNGLFLSLEMVQMLRLNTSEGNLVRQEQQVFENMIPTPAPRRSSDGGGPKSNIVYALQTKSPMDSHPGHKDDGVEEKPKDVLVRLLWESKGSVFEAQPFDSVNSWVRGCPASYNLTIMEAVRRDNSQTIRNMFESGCDLQCANKWGETILHAVARYGRLDILKFLVEEAGVSMRVCCDGGRTILHDGCWTVNPSWECISYILKSFPDLLYIADKRGSTPLDYAPKDAWIDWKLFLEANQDVIFSKEVR